MEPHSALPLSSSSASRTSKNGVDIISQFLRFSSQLLLSYPLIWCFFCLLDSNNNSHRHDEPPQLLGEDCELWSQAAKVARWAARAQARGKRRAAEEAGTMEQWSAFYGLNLLLVVLVVIVFNRSIIKLVLKVFFWDISTCNSYHLMQQSDRGKTINPFWGGPTIFCPGTGNLQRQCCRMVSGARHGDISGSFGSDFWHDGQVTLWTQCYGC